MVNLNASCDTLFGGSNISGDIANSFVNINGGTAESVYGGNNAGGITNRSQLIFMVVILKICMVVV